MKEITLLSLTNPFLYREPIQACGDGMEVRCFDNVIGAIKDFGKGAGVKAQKLSAEEKSKEIEKELQALAQRNWAAVDNDTLIDLLNRLKSSSRAPLFADAYKGELFP
jgi:hypothetical protein